MKYSTATVLIASLARVALAVPARDVADAALLDMKEAQRHGAMAGGSHNLTRRNVGAQGAAGSGQAARAQGNMDSKSGGGLARRQPSTGALAMNLANADDPEAEATEERSSLIPSELAREQVGSGQGAQASAGKTKPKDAAAQASAGKTKPKAMAAASAAARSTEPLALPAQSASSQLEIEDLLALYSRNEMAQDQVGSGPGRPGSGR